MKSFVICLLVLFVFAVPAFATHFDPVVTFVPAPVYGYGAVGGNLLVVPSNAVYAPHFGFHSFGFAPSVSVEVGRTRVGRFGSVGFSRRRGDVTIIQSGGRRTFVIR